MTEQLANFGIGITASNQTEKGAREAEKRLERIPKRVSDTNRRAARESERGFLRSSRSIIGSLGRIEQATARALGGRSLTAGLAGRLSAVGEAGEAAGAGLSEAAGAGGALAGAASGVAVAVGAAVAVLAAGAYAAFRLGDGWAKGAAQIGRTAAIIGVGTKALQEFNAAAERVGVDKGTATGALGGLSQTLNDARYGRNTGALEAMRRLGIGMVLNKDGTVNVDAMLPRIADALARQNSSGRRTAARLLGIPEAALPVFTQGGKALSGNMRDADRTAAVMSDRDIADAQRIASKSVRVGQLAERLKAKAGSAIAREAEPGYDQVLKAGETFSHAVDDGFRPAIDDMRKSVDKFGQTVDRMAGAFTGTIQSFGAAFSGDARDRAARLIAYFESVGWSHAQAAGIVGNFYAESGLNPHGPPGDGGRARGLAQLHPDRQAMFRKIFGKDLSQASDIEQAAFTNWELHNTFRDAGNRLRGATNPRQAGAIVSQYYERPRDTDYEIGKRATIAESLAAIPVHVTVEHRNPPPGTRTTVRAGRSGNPAVSTAMAH